MGIFEKRVLGIKFGTKGEDVKEGRKKIHNEELHQILLG
jgi:hypothetical protein